MPTESTNDQMTWGNVSTWIVKFGLPSVLAGFLVWSLRLDVLNQLASIRMALENHQVDTVYYIKAADLLRDNQAKTNLILQQICVNGAAVTEIANCFR